MSYAKIDQLSLPSTGQLADGRWVSNYHLLPDTVLKAEGWLPLEEVKPLLADGQYHELSGVVQFKDRIVATYIAKTPAPDPIQVELDRYKVAVDKALAVNVTTALKDTLIATLTTLKADVATVEVKDPIIKEA